MGGGVCGCGCGCVLVCGCVSGWVGRWREKERERFHGGWLSCHGGWQVWNLQGGPAGWRSRQASAAVKIQRLIARRVPDRSLLWNHNEIYRQLWGDPTRKLWRGLWTTLRGWSRTLPKSLPILHPNRADRQWSLQICRVLGWQGLRRQWG